MNPAETMRVMLANNEIFLDLPRADVMPASTPKAPDVAVDRDLIREILVDRGAAAGDLEWLVESCPSVRDAEDFRPPPHTAWCVDCGSEQLADIAGCLACRRSE